MSSKINLIKSLQNGQWIIESLNKVGEGYKKLMSNGVALLHPVEINGKSISDDGVPYHVTIKAFDRNKDSLVDVHKLASGLNMRTPDPHKVTISPHIFKDRFGDDVHVLTMHGEDADDIIQNNSKFNDMGWPNRPEGFRPHITVDKATYDRAMNGKVNSAADLGISFSGPELREGFDTILEYKKQAVKKSVDAPPITRHEPLDKNITRKELLKTSQNGQWELLEKVNYNQCDLIESDKYPSPINPMNKS